MTEFLDPDSPIAHEAAEMAREVLSAGLLLQVDRILDGPIFEAGKRVFGGTEEDLIERTTYFTCLLAAMVKLAVIAAATKDRREDGPIGNTLAATITAAREDGWTI